MRSRAWSTLLVLLALGCGGRPIVGFHADGGPAISGDGSATNDGAPNDVVTSICSVGQLLCGVACVDLGQDPANCGACGTACAAGQVCSVGRCAASCAAGLVTCGQSCVDLTSDAANCSGCGKACGAGQECSAGVCACSVGQVACGATCADVGSDPANCGTCGKACATGQVCSAGACAASCGAGLTSCGGACQDLKERRRELRCLRQQVRRRNALRGRPVRVSGRTDAVRGSVHRSAHESRELRRVRHDLHGGPGLRCRHLRCELPHGASHVWRLVRRRDLRRRQLRRVREGVHRRHHLPGRALRLSRGRDAMRRCVCRHRRRRAKLWCVWPGLRCRPGLYGRRVHGDLPRRYDAL